MHGNTGGWGEKMIFFPKLNNINLNNFPPNSSTKVVQHIRLSLDLQTYGEKSFKFMSFNYKKSEVNENPRLKIRDFKNSRMEKSETEISETNLIWRLNLDLMYRSYGYCMQGGDLFSIHYQPQGL